MIRYYPDIDVQRQAMKQTQKRLAGPASKELATMTNQLLIQSGQLARTDGIPDKMIDDSIAKFENLAKHEKDPEKKAQYNAWMERGESISDLTPNLYQRLRKEPNTMSYWLPALEKAVAACPKFFKIPSTMIWTLPIEIAQYLRIDYQDTNPASRELFNKLCQRAFNLDPNKSYFIKTGVFSSKFEFRNTHCTEPLEMGDYFSVINNFAMLVGAGRSVDLVVRDWIDDVENRPTIYNGMPLHTEFRCFIDCDKDDLIGIVPYWNPLVMKRVLASQGRDNPSIYQDYETYKRMEATLLEDFNNCLPKLSKEILPVIKNLDLSGRWSLDIMKNGHDFYLIDMATMASSALTELL